MEVRLGGRGWKSLAEAKRWAQCVLHDYDDGDTLEGFNARLVRDMLDLHTHRDWYLSHGDVMRIDVEQQGKDKVFVIYVGPDRQRFYFGLSNIRFRPKTQHRKVSDLARALIVDQIKAFRAVTPIPPQCTLCGTPITPDCSLAVDHVESFAGLLAAYVEQNPAPEDLRSDAAWTRQWQEYHSVHAVLRIVHARCNSESGSHGDE